MRLRSTCDRLRCLPLIPQLVQRPKSLISLALLAVSRRCAIRSNFSRPLVGRVIPEPRRLDHGRRPAAPRLLVLAGKIVFADRRADLLDDRQQLALGVQCLAAPPGTRVPAELSIERRLGPLR
jgi:hypothetical protein